VKIRARAPSIAPMRRFALLLLVACGPPPCDRTSQHVPGYRCYEEEVGQEPCSVTSSRRLRCQEEPPEPLGGTAHSGIFFWRDAGRECFPP
jgi:hypothetical protein